MNDSRKAQLNAWVNGQLSQLLELGSVDIELTTVSGDASFRRYFRAQLPEQSFIAVDAPPDNESSELFVEIAGYLREAGVKSPKVFAKNYAEGFLLLEDFGDRLYLPRLLTLQDGGMDSISEYQVESLYKDAIRALVKIQSKVDKKRLAPYNREKLRTEMQLFEDWFCKRFLGLDLSASDHELIASAFTFLEEAALGQTQLAVHRDYHSRNLLILDDAKFAEGEGPGIIDFQDAMAGAYSYDLVSLLRDCYIRWSPDLVESLALHYFELASSAGLVEGVAASQFRRDFDLMGLQRNFKVMGIFSRLCIRDNKPQYLADIPLVIQYFLEVACKYEEMAPFLDWFETNVLIVAKAKLNLEL
ncbi:MAG: phosphotransferase [SAR86 cluster bacterium]|uniref:Phosphotransferase n=1 Tax=SAR86 cluster bacterium TaxID=2030880 RepID=A0A2A4X2N6_9GAMM|nr:MAG: phosphotransferase [SAR86 cluster bacterium]